MHYMDDNLTHGEKAWQQLHKDAESNIEQYCWRQHPQSSSFTVTYHLSRKLSKLDEPDMQNTAGEVGTNS